MVSASGGNFPFIRFGVRHGSEGVQETVRRKTGKHGKILVGYFHRKFPKRGPRGCAGFAVLFQDGLGHFR
jgi:hypothetical protein